MLKTEDTLPSFSSSNEVVKPSAALLPSTINAHVRQGSVHGLIGPNGAGKTTVINLITGLFHPEPGNHSFRRQAARENGSSGHRRARHHPNLSERQAVQRHDGARAGDDAGVIWCAARAVGILPRAARARAQWEKTRAHAMHLLDRVAMGHRADELAETSSYGEQRRIEIARALGSDSQAAPPR